MKLPITKWDVICIHNKNNVGYDNCDESINDNNESNSDDVDDDDDTKWLKGQLLAQFWIWM